MRRTITIWAAILGIGAVASFAQQTVHERYRDDPRLVRLARFLHINHCPTKHLAADFLAAADVHGLDWRLLPSISVAETGGGRMERKNNIFGWDSARKGFASIKEGIYAVAARLSGSKLYKGKDLDGVLRTYNRNPQYAQRIKTLMLKVDSSEPPKARWTAAAALGDD